VTARLVFLFSLLAYLAVIGPFTGYLKDRPVAEKMGYLPEAKALKYLVADHRPLVGEWAVMKVIFYYGGLLMPEEGGVRFSVPPEYYAMFRTLQTALRLDPYNTDAYYFAQAAFTWDVGRVKEVNNMLDYGMRYRTWDYQLPFFAGFNAAYFLKDYTRAAEYMEKAAMLSGEPLFTTLAARYFYEAGREDLGILFLDSMQKSVKEEKVKKVLQMRREALAAVKSIREASELFRTRNNREPASVEELVDSGFLRQVPVDPYGGRFFIADDGTVASTSRFALKTEK
jgi:hypothetical protein